MCDPVIGTAMLIGAATGAAGAAITGGDVLQGAMFGAVTGAITGGMGGFGEGSFLTNLGGGSGIMATDIATSTAFGTITQGSALAFAGTSLVGSVGMGMLAPPQVGYTPAAQVSQQQQLRALNMNTNIATTGSGGRQAATSLAAAISRTKKRKLTQDDVGDLSLDTSSFTNTGLQLA
jgi:hypothetical protein